MLDALVTEGLVIFRTIVTAVEAQVSSCHI